MSHTMYLKRMTHPLKEIQNKIESQIENIEQNDQDLT
jgi:hypothetical protein